MLVIDLDTITLEETIDITKSKAKHVENGNDADEEDNDKDDNVKSKLHIDFVEKQDPYCLYGPKVEILDLDTITQEKTIDITKSKAQHVEDRNDPVEEEAMRMKVSKASFK